MYDEQTMESGRTGVPFAFFVSLLQAIAAITPRNVKQTSRFSYKEVASRTLANWLAELHRRYDPLPPDTTLAFFRLLFPDEDVSRKYGVQETKLAKYLADILVGTTSPHGRGNPLFNWKNNNGDGCLGSEVMTLLGDSPVVETTDLTMIQVDALLTELACGSAFSASHIRDTMPSHRPPRTILQCIYRELEPASAGFLTQIILKDLRPLLYPLSETHYSASLLRYNSKAVTMLTKDDVMKAWDTSGRMLRAYRLSPSLEGAARIYENGEEEIQIQLGVPIQIPKCVKGQGCAKALQYLRKAKKVWAETKYDGERAQIHVQIDEFGNSNITIFSKSKRDSTLDRFAVHSIIREALGLQPVENSGASDGHNPARPSKITSSVILEAEMVAFSDSLNKVDEFWRIRSLISATALGVRRGKGGPPKLPSESQLAEMTQCSLISNADDDGTRHLALIFFDVLYIDSVNVMHKSYAHRRSLLEGLIECRPGYAMLAERVAIDMYPFERGLHRLEGVFAMMIADFQEGAVLKADEGRYNDWHLPWVKLKKDYIDGYGDCVDLVLFGARWNKDRARILRVAPSVFTTFYFGAVTNTTELLSEPGAQPRFGGIFTVEWGLDREKLEELNFMIRSSDPVELLLDPTDDLPEMPFSYDWPRGLARPDVLLETPLVGEIFGAGFTKAPQRTFYEPRFPRITKIFRRSERSWRDGMTMQDFQKIAREAVGKDRPNKDVDDWCNEIWGQPSSPSVNSTTKRKMREADWEEKLAAADGRRRNKARRLDLEDLENTEVSNLRRVEPPKTPSSLRAFGSMTNLFAGSLDALVQGQPVEGDARSPTCTPIVTNIDETAQHTKTPTSRPATSAHSNDSSDGRSRSSPSPQGSTDKVLDCVQPITSLSTPTLTPALKYAGTPMAKFLTNAVVWLLRPAGAARPSWRVPSHHIIPQGQQVNSFDAFLMACGWEISDSDVQGCTWAKRGVLFVDNERDLPLLEHTIKQLVQRRSKILKDATVVQNSKSVFVFSMRQLSHSELMCDSDADVTSRAICRFG